MYRYRLIALMLVVLTTTVSAAPPVPIGKTFVGHDTLKPKRDELADAQACLDGLVWPAVEFEIRCDRARERTGDMLIRFPSPVPTGDANNDLVAMEWYVAHDED